MLIEFKITNFSSIHETQTLSMVAGSGIELEEENVCKADFDKELRLVRAAAIYGPNAAGKSNLIRALETMRRIVLESAKEIQRGEYLDIDPFLFDTKATYQPSRFEIIFSKDNVRYEYGFEADKDRIYNEWLFSFPNERTQQWFVRQYDKANDLYDYKFSTHFKGGKKQHDLWKNSTKSNTLFFSNAVLLSNDQLNPIFDWFQKDLKIIKNLDQVSIEKSIEMIKNPKTKAKMMRLMASADPSIKDIVVADPLKKVVKDNVDEIKHQFEPKEEIKLALLEHLFFKDQRVKFVHDNNVSPAFKKESDGTRRMFGIAGYWVDLLERGGVLVIDEMDNSLHPILVKSLVTLVNGPNNKNGAQLIFSTHDTTLLDSELFRRDQIWFVEKDQKNASKLYSLLDFSPRKHETYGKYYLQGRYGALPYIGDWKF